MPSTSLNPDKMTPATLALFDLLSDSEWHSNQALIAFGAEYCITHEREESLKNGYRVRRKSIAAGNTVEENDLIASGAKDIVRNRLMIAVRGGRLERTKTEHRMLPDVAATWRELRADVITPATDRPHLSLIPGGADTSDDLSTGPDDADASAPTKRRYTSDLIFGGMSEADGFAASPLLLKSRVHFKAENSHLDLDAFRADLPLGCEVAYDEVTGLYRVDCTHGTGQDVRDFIRDWCTARDITIKSLRAEDDVRRRHISTLDPQFLSDLCMHYASYIRGRVQKHKSTLQFHFADRDDEQQQVFEWILEAVARFDATASVPFGAFLSGRISMWVHDLSRSKWGRNATDTELKYQRAMADFTSEHGRKPTEREMAELLGQNLTTYRKNAQVVSTIQGLRNVATLDTAPDQAEVPLPDDETSDTRYNAALQQSLLSQIMTDACTVDPETRGKLATYPNILGWVSWYETTWGQKSKTELSKALDTSMRNMNEYHEKTRVRMQRRSADISD